MSIKGTHKRSVVRIHDTASDETLHSLAPVYFYDDFLGKDLMLSESGSAGIWEDVVVATGGTVTVATADDFDNGVAQLALDNTDEAQDAVLYWGDVRGIDIANDCVFEMRAGFSVLPTTGVTVVAGMAGDHNAAKDSVTEAAWFRWQASAAALAETDDTTNNNDDISTGETLVAAAFHIFRIDFTALSDVKFSIDGACVATGTTFDMSNLTAAEARMQPYFSLDKASGTGVGTLEVDYVRIWAKRS